MRTLLRPSLLLLSLIPFSSAADRNTTASLNIVGLMSENSCKTFADLLYFSANVADCFTSNIVTGITIFCPSDPFFKPFLPQFNNLSADGKISLLLYHAIPVYYSMSMMRSGNGVVNTLATDGIDKNYNFTIENDGDVVKLRTEVVTARITGTIVDAEPVGLYSIDDVLMPEELFKPEKVVAPAVGPAVVVDSPKGGEAGPDGKAGDENGVGNSRAVATAEKFIVTAVGAVFALF